MKAFNMMVGQTNHTRWDPHTVLARPWVSLGHVGVRMGWGRRPDRKEEKVHESDGHEGVRDLCPE